MADSNTSPVRSTSRGRDAFLSSGRGGIGNIRQTSQDPTRADPDNASPARGREPTVNPERVLYTGRGGAGNIRSASNVRSPSRATNDTTASTASTLATAADYERGVIQNSEEAAKQGVHSSGRGGLGNIRSPSRSQSRGPARTPPVHSTGRGGIGNLVYISPEQPNAIAEEKVERQRHARAEEGIHSTGRGGLANITSLPSPPPDYTPPQPTPIAESTGRGGAGNIIRSRSASRGPERSRSRSASKDRHGLAHLWNKLTQDRDERADSTDAPQSLATAPITEVNEGGENTGSSAKP
ncbi:hypothetical protein CERSUDRAFT_88593 [Gelatoporia subvermispora B]|uniref:Uncharacterized protein n=1 Tax=Ceriporiopsis subvermispora (strain B) TaxID=914234 RepID=M2QZK2_CERS8|nr:hypothetical protein CERSUDRAFT_88593 [Gelatoporia subvermispora B]